MKQRDEREEKIEEDEKESKQESEARQKKNFEQEKANLLWMIECEWFDQALIEKRWNLQTVNDVERKSIV